MVETIRHSRRTTSVAVSVAFAANGLVFASWIPRVPALRDSLELSSTQLGLLLLCLSAGSVAALPASGPLVHRLGPARVVAGGALAVAGGLSVAALGISAGSVVSTALALVVVGAGTGAWDVAMNVEGAAVERRLGRSIMPRLHGLFSLGTVAGAAVAATAAGLRVPLPTQLLVISPIVAVVVLLAVRRFLPAATPEDPGRRDEGFGLRQAWREPRTLLVGLMTLGFALTEGAANDWLAVAVVDGFGASETAAAVAFAAFVSAMTVGRLGGGVLIARWGRPAVLRTSAAVTLLGLLVVIVAGVSGGGLAWAYVGALLWGGGTALGFPAGVSAASDDPARAAIRVSVVSSIAYTAFLAGPPVIGLLADAIGQPQALVVVAAAAALAATTAGATRPEDQRARTNPAHPAHPTHAVASAGDRDGAA